MVVYGLLAVNYKKQNREEEAISTLENALKICGPSGSIVQFLELGQAMIELLQQLKNKDVYKSLVEKILNAFRTKAHIPGPGEAIPDYEASLQQIDPSKSQLLSPREIDTLRLLTDGLRNKEIADKLYVTTDTVKKHLYNIFIKLNVKNRLELVNKANEMGILSQNP